MWVDPQVSKAKFEQELELWNENADHYRRRGWVLLGQGDLTVDIGFLSEVSLGQHVLPVLTATIRVDYRDYDLMAPSVAFVDPLSGEFAQPLVPALIETDEGPRDLLVQSHPESNRPFFCVPGVREYHSHPQHSGDSWLLHRDTGEGRLASICDRVWRSMARNVLGVQVNIQTLPARQAQLQLKLVNAPGDVAQVLAERAKQAEQAQRDAAQEAREASSFAALGGVVPHEQAELDRQSPSL